MYILALFLLLISGSIFLSAFFNRRFADTIPLNCMFISACLFIFGLFGILKIGVYVVTIILSALLIISILNLIKNKEIKHFSKSFFKYDFIVFTVIYIILYLLTFRKVANSWDEFSYWLSSVKDMSYLDDFITNPESLLGFKSYPPIMGLLQYYCEKIYFCLNRTNVFNEGLAFFIYKIFCLSFIFPFFKKESFNNVLNSILSLSLFLFPVFFFNRFYNTIYIDPFVGILAGTAIARIFMEKNKDILFNIFISLNVFTLVLAKDVGLYFAIFVSIIYALDYYFNRKPECKYSKVLFIFLGLIPFITTFIAKIAWKIEVITSEIEISFSEPFDFVSYLGMFFLHNDTSWKQTVVDNFKKAFFENRFQLGDILGFGTSYFILTLLFIALCITIIFFYQKRKVVNYKKSYVITTCSILFFMVTLYVFSLGATYVARFSEYEALNLASYERYLNIAYLTIYLFIVLFFYDYAICTQAKHKKLIDISILAVLLILLPKKSTGGFLVGYNVKKDLREREPYNNLNNKIQNEIKEKSKIYFISQEDSGYDILVMAFICKPHVISGTYSIGEPFYEGDIWTQQMDLEEFSNILFHSDYDYLAIYKTNDYFNETYNSVFEEPEKIANNTLFKINRETEKVELCQ